MKHFKLAGIGYRNMTDLTGYADDIEHAVNMVKPGATVDVHKTYFTTNPELSKRESITVSTILRQDAMFDLTTYRPCMFISTQYLTKAVMEETNGNNNDDRDSKNNEQPQKMGGRVRDSKRVPSDKQKGNKKARKGQS